MNAEWLHWLGYPAAILTTIAFVPQAWLTVRTRNVDGISAATYLALTVGVLLWLAYGIGERDWALVAANAVTLPLAASILVTKLRHNRQRAGERPHSVSARP
jgi:MtN3 and saliva related transmembrane protein